MSYVTKKLSFSAISITCTLLAASAAIAVTGCGDDGSETTPPAAKVDVPAIEGAVAAEDFCALSDEIHCAGAVGCCSGAATEYASIEECIQRSSCQKNMDKVLQSPILAAGTLTYDAAAAGDYLRALASKTSTCGPQAESLLKQPFFVGTLDEGADCTSQSGDPANGLACKPGLECALTLDDVNGIATGLCAKAAAPTSGNACASSDDCSSGSCEGGVCTEEERSYCTALPEETAPSNADPTYLYIDLAGDNSGTSGDVILRYANGGKFWSCTITDTLSDGQEKVCAVTSTGTVTNSTKEFFQIEMSSSDGMKVDTVCACESSTDNKCGSSIECVGSFFDPGNNSDWSDGCLGFNLEGQWCSRIWLDSNSHGDCTAMQITDSVNGNSNWTNCY